MFLANINLSDEYIIALISIAFVLVIVLVWIIIAKIVKSVKTDKYYEKLAKENLASLGFDEFKEDNKNKKDSKEAKENKNTKPADSTEEAKPEVENKDSEPIVPIIATLDNNEEERVEPIVEEEALEETFEDREAPVEEAKPEEENPIETASLDEEALEEPVEEAQEEAVEEPKAEEPASEEAEEVKPDDDTEAKLDTEEPVALEEAPEENLKKDVEPKTVEAEDSKEETDVEEDKKPKRKGRTYNGKYEIYQTADGYAYNLKASNGELLVMSETYKTREGVIKAINAVKRNLETGEVRIFADKRGQYKFKLVSKNYRILAISSNYSVEKSAIRASESFKKFALKADLVDVELVDKDSKTATLIDVTGVDSKKDGKFFVEKFNGEFSWALKASNGQILCQAEGYTSKAGCMYSIETFKRNVAEGTFKCVKDKVGNFQYKLYNNSGRICAVGESYQTKQSAESAARSVVSFYADAVVLEVQEEKPSKKK